MPKKNQQANFTLSNQLNKKNGQEREEGQKDGKDR